MAGVEGECPTDWDRRLIRLMARYGSAELYDPLAIPKTLRDAHADLDRAVDKRYRPAPFPSERARVE